jgi:hypothetical protein
VLFRRGKPQAQDELAVAIVGTRHATHYGPRKPNGWPAAWLGQASRW